MEIVALLSSLMGLAFVSGLRLYGTILVLGLGIRMGFIHLDPAMSRLEILGEPLIIAIAGLIYLVEFVADKIPWVDSAWDSIHISWRHWTSSGSPGWPGFFRRSTASPGAA